MSNPLSRLLEQEDVVIDDGAMGTNLFPPGFGKGDNGAARNVERPGAVTRVRMVAALASHPKGPPPTAATSNANWARSSRPPHRPGQ